MTSIQIQGVTMSHQAACNVGEVAADVAGDVTAVRTGMSRETLLAKCLDGADADRIDGWREYVDAVVLAAGL